MRQFSEGSNSPLRRKHVPEGDTQGLVLLPSQHQRPEGTQCSCHSPGCGGDSPWRARNVSCSSAGHGSA